MFNIGLPEFIFIAVAALVLLGPEKLPTAVRGLAKVIRDVRRIASQLQSQLDPEIKSVAGELRDALDGRIEPSPPPLSARAGLRPIEAPPSTEALAPPPPSASPAPPAPASAPEEELELMIPRPPTDGAPVARGASSGGSNPPPGEHGT